MTLEYAYQLKKHYSSLIEDINKAFSRSKQQIEEILIAPADEINQWHFYKLYMECRNNSEALSFYRYGEYCVLALVREHQEDNEILYSYQVLSDILKTEWRYEGTNEHKTRA